MKKNKKPLMNAATHTDLGSREVNQDRLFAEVDNEQAQGLFCIADGMGGLSDGHYAASVTVDVVEFWWRERRHLLNQKGHSIILDDLTDLLNAINNALLGKAKEANIRIGTTCSLLFVSGSFYYIAHAGDSRIYMANKKTFGKKRIELLTDDHTWGDDQLKAGRLTRDEVNIHPKKDRLTSCLGTFDTPRIYTRYGALEKGMVFILCSDGMYRVVSEVEIADMALGKLDCATLATQLVSTALKRGTTDNTSVVTVKINNVRKSAKQIKNQYEDFTRTDP